MSSELYVPVVPLVSALESAGRAVARGKLDPDELHTIRVQIAPGPYGGVTVSATDRYRVAHTRVTEHPELAGCGQGAGQILVFRTAAAELVRALKASRSYTDSVKRRWQGAALVRITDSGTLAVSTLPERADEVFAKSYLSPDGYPALGRLMPDADADLIRVSFPADVLSRMARALDLMTGPGGEKDQPVRLMFVDAGEGRCTMTQAGREDQIAILVVMSPTPPALARGSVAFRPSQLVDAIRSTGAGEGDEVSLWFEALAPTVQAVLFRCGDQDPRDERAGGHLLIPVKF